MWLISTFSREGTTDTIFAPQEQAIGLILLLIPYLTVVFMSPDELPNYKANHDNAQQDAA